VSLNFSNESRSYDATRLAVRFYGYDGALEASFFVVQDALSKLAGRGVVGEGEGLAMFDANRARIREGPQRLLRVGSQRLLSGMLQERPRKTVETQPLSRVAFFGGCSRPS
jgi:hypothetical protein